MTVSFVVTCMTCNTRKTIDLEEMKRLAAADDVPLCPSCGNPVTGQTVFRKLTAQAREAKE